jgi:hypothetical protein
LYSIKEPPILGFPQYNKPFELHTDASMLGFGAVLYQEQDHQKRVIAYGSRRLGKSEKNYPVHIKLSVVTDESKELSNFF